MELHSAAEIGALAAAWVRTFLGDEQTTFSQTNANSVNPANKSGIFTLSQIQHHSCTYNPLKSTFKQILLLNLGRASHHASRSTQGEQASQAVIRFLISPPKASSLHLHGPCGVPGETLEAGPGDPRDRLVAAAPLLPNSWIPFKREAPRLLLLLYTAKTRRVVGTTPAHLEALWSCKRPAPISRWDQTLYLLWFSFARQNVSLL